MGSPSDVHPNIISEVEEAAGFVGTQERCRVCCFTAGQVGTLFYICLILCFNHKAMVAAVTVILAIGHMAL